MLKRYFLIFLLLFFSKNIFSLEDIPREYGLNNDLGLYTETVEINRLLPFISVMRAVTLVNVAMNIVKRPDFTDIFDDLPESEFKNELRRQYYLYTKGSLIDKVPISFSVLELLNAGLFEQRIAKALDRGELDLSFSKISSLNGLSDLLDRINMPIKSLDLKNNELDNIYITDFPPYLSRLENLILSNNNIYELDSGCFDNLKNLVFIDLGQNYIVSLPDYIFSNCSRLKKIDLSDNSIRRLDKKVFFGLKDSLKKINLADNPLKNLPDDFWQGFTKLINVYQ